jgi:DNA-binding NarL/FixJ family response regulator
MNKILIFEDNENYRNSLSDIINLSEDLEVCGTYGDCRMIKEVVSLHKPDLVILDIDMPHVDGLQGLYILKQNFPEVKAIMLTIFEENDKLFNAICLGAEGYLLKHTKPEKIIESVFDTLDGGSPMSPTIARKVLTVFKETGFSVPFEYHLSKKELETLTLLVNGNSYKMIAVAQDVSINTIRTHIKSIYIKLSVNSVSEAVAKAIREQIVGH